MVRVYLLSNVCMIIGHISNIPNYNAFYLNTIMACLRIQRNFNNISYSVLCIHTAFISNCSLLTALNLNLLTTLAEIKFYENLCPKHSYFALSFGIHLCQGIFQGNSLPSSCAPHPRWCIGIKQRNARAMHSFSLDRLLRL